MVFRLAAADHGRFTAPKQEFRGDSTELRGDPALKSQNTGQKPPFFLSRAGAGKA
ncbi:hypothetical protein [Sterolibacterium denitrificans]|uniref:hypothetical protein n=1 Tax=Sterolibacterium denitrificans TaxID=157592 RepID=UPI0012B68C09|nr:hypothetical protein [Sterolibacterium denitrificans]